MYTVEGLANGIEKCRDNITLLEEAIEKERGTIKDYRTMIESIEESNRKVAEANNGVHIEVANGD